MFSFLKSHPFAIEAYFDRSAVLTFTIAKKELRSLIPECLELDVFDDKWAFIAVAMVQTKGLRPKGFPKLFGSDFILIGYRVFVVYRNSSGRNMRGLYILRSETDGKRMKFFGNVFTHYNYDVVDISRSVDGNKETIKSAATGFEVSTESAGDKVSLPPLSPFADWKRARRYSGPLPFTFTFDRKHKRVLIIEGVRQNWHPRPLTVTSYKIPYLEEIGLADAKLAAAFEVRDIPYWWKKGRFDPWTT